ncbi:MAG: S46 family peptidase [Planctomycetota bacterium]
MMAVSAPAPVRGDEGMHLFNALPRQMLQSRHGFEATEQWAEHLRLSSVRFNSGGSGSFISSNGLVLTNHHVASETLQKLSTPERNLLEDGYLAQSLDQELQAPDLELNQLVAIIDVTDEVEAAVDADDETESAKQRQAAIAKIEARSLEESGQRSDVVKLFGGAKYHLYRYKKYTDVRLVWAPETAAAFFGGDADNFEYPRYNLDATIMRVYEDGKPAKLEHFLAWSEKPLDEGDLVFVSGNPGRTQRIFTVDALKFLRDQRIPYLLDFLRRKEVLLQQFSLGGVEAKRRARDELFGIQNARKAYTGMLAGLQDPATMVGKQQREDHLRAGLKGSKFDGNDENPFDVISESQSAKADRLGQDLNLRSELFRIAMQIVLLTAEDQKPNEERLAEFSDARRPSLLQKLYSTAPLYRDLEQFKLADELSRVIEAHGADTLWVQEMMAGKGPRDRAADLVAGTRVDEVDFRKSLVAGGRDGLEKSDDALIQLALMLEPDYREHRAEGDAIDEREVQAYAKLADLIREVEGSGGYPDATFTLRLAFGLVKGYREDGKTIQPKTDFAGAFRHAEEHKGQDDFDLPESWYKHREKINLSTDLNFVCTADIIGGNSGSPVVDRDGKLVGLIFDGNIQSLVSDYAYTDTQARAVSVAGVGILKALRSIYNAPALADSIGK